VWWCHSARTIPIVLPYPSHLVPHHGVGVCCAIIGRGASCAQTFIAGTAINNENNKEINEIIVMKRT